MRKLQKIFVTKKLHKFLKKSIIKEREKQVEKNDFYYNRFILH